MVKDNKVHILDFGLSFEYISKDQHIQEQAGQSFKGTLHYASIKNHQRYNMSRKDDLEGIGYTILYLLTNGHYKWLDFEHSEKHVTQWIH